MAATPDLDALPVEERIKWLYEHGKGSIQDYARIYRMTVDEVLTILGQGELSTVTTQGDLVDPGDLLHGTPINPGDTHKVPYSTD